MDFLRVSGEVLKEPESKEVRIPFHRGLKVRRYGFQVSFSDGKDQICYGNGRFPRHLQSNLPGMINFLKAYLQVFIV